MGESYELAMKLVGMDPDNDDDFDNEGKVSELLLEKYGIEDPDIFEKLIQDLLPMIAVGESILTQKTYKGFSADGQSWLCKVEA